MCLVRNIPAGARGSKGLIQQLPARPVCHDVDFPGNFVRHHGGPGPWASRCYLHLQPDLVFALSAAGAIYLVLELGQRFAGLMQISNAPLRNALTPLSP